MAGSGWRQFTIGQLLTAAQVQGYLQDQSVQVHASAAARSSALGTAVSAGMVSYRSDDKALELYAGSAWTPVMRGRNAIINGAFDINQRAYTSSSTASPGSYHLDRWKMSRGGTSGTATISVETFTPGTAPVAGYEGKNYLRLVTTGYSNEDSWSSPLQQSIEGVRTFAGQTVTLSFWAKAASGTPSLGFRAVQYFGGFGGSTQVNTYVPKITISTSWTRYSVVFNIPSIAGKTLGTAGDDFLNFTFVASAGSSTYDGSFGSMLQNNTFDFWGVQVEAGSVATPFTRAATTLQGELAACQRYYVRWNAGDAYSPFAMGIGESSTRIQFNLNTPVQMRTVASAIDYSAIAAYDTSSVISISALSLNFKSPNICNISATVTGATQFRPYFLFSNNNTAGYVGISAEL